MCIYVCVHIQVRIYLFSLLVMHVFIHLFYVLFVLHNVFLCVFKCIHWLLVFVVFALFWFPVMMWVMEIVKMITVTTPTNVSCLNNYKMTFVQWRFHLSVATKLELWLKKLLVCLSHDEFKKKVFSLSFSAFSVLEEESPTALKNDERWTVWIIFMISHMLLSLTM